MHRVGGRLQTAHHLPHAMRHPVILPSKHPVTELIIADVDLKHKHCAGTNHLATELSARFWIVHAVQLLKGRDFVAMAVSVIETRQQHP